MSNELIRMLICIDDEDTAREFLLGAMTPHEVEEIVKRIHIASALHQKKPYSKIENELDVSSTTIAKVSKEMKNRPIYAQLIYDMGAVSP